MAEATADSDEASVHETIAVIGGTGALGKALAARWARAGLRVVIGSRAADRARATAKELGAAGGDDNARAAARADVVVVTVPFASQRDILETLRPHVAGKLVVDATVPLVPPRVATVQLPAEGSAAQIAQATLGPEVAVVSAFHNVAAAKVAADAPVDCDVLVFGDDAAACERIEALTRKAGLQPVRGGRLANSAAAEALTSVLIGINRRYRVPGAGIRITGLGEEGR